MNSRAASMCLEENISGRWVDGGRKVVGKREREGRVGGEREEREVDSLYFSSNISHKSI